jgi:hypothetical protein
VPVESVHTEAINNWDGGSFFTEAEQEELKRNQKKPFRPFIMDNFSEVRRGKEYTFNHGKRVAEADAQYSGGVFEPEILDVSLKEDDLYKSRIDKVSAHFKKLNTMKEPIILSLSLGFPDPDQYPALYAEIAKFLKRGNLFIWAIDNNPEFAFSDPFQPSNMLKFLEKIQGGIPNLKNHLLLVGNLHSYYKAILEKSLDEKYIGIVREYLISQEFGKDADIQNLGVTGGGTFFSSEDNKIHTGSSFITPKIAAAMKQAMLRLMCFGQKLEWKDALEKMVACFRSSLKKMSGFLEKKEQMTMVMYHWNVVWAIL